jgi:hypothetical protein
MKRSLICFCILMVLNGPGFSQTTKAKPAFYVVLDSLQKKCSVVDRIAQTGTANIALATDAVYKTRVEAETAVKTLKPCN